MEKALVGLGIIGALIGVVGVAYGLSKKSPAVEPKYRGGFQKDQSQGLYLPQYDKW